MSGEIINEMLIISKGYSEEGGYVGEEIGRFAGVMASLSSVRAFASD